MIVTLGISVGSKHPTSYKYSFLLIAQYITVPGESASILRVRSLPVCVKQAKNTCLSSTQREVSK
jgi:hypothetical protein